MIGIDYNIVKRQGWKVGKNLINMKSGRNENVEILGKLVEWNIEAIIVIEMQGIVGMERKRHCGNC